MMQLNNDKIAELVFSKICIVEDRNMWNACSESFDKTDDLILCVDFGLKKELQDSGYNVEFVDHLVDNKILEKLNFEVYGFLNSFFKDKQGRDILNYKGLDLSDSHMMFIINDVGYFAHFFFNLIALKSLRYENLIVAVNDEIILGCLNKIGLRYKPVNAPVTNSLQPVYFFPILKWISEKTRRRPLSYILKNTAAGCFDFAFRIIDKVFNKTKKRVYINRYYPTIPLAKELQKDKSIQLIFNNYSGLKNIFEERRIYYKEKKEYFIEAKKLLTNFNTQKSQAFCYEGYDVAGFLYEIIEGVLEKKLPSTIGVAESVLSYFEKENIDLMIPVTNLWVENRLIMKYCQANNIPVFMILNGLLALSFYNDAKDSDYVNCYSESVKTEYFKNAPYAIPLGDPRMDINAMLSPKEIDYVNPTLVIGTAGYNPTDLNSYLAVEFDFIYDILHTVQKLNEQGKKIDIVLKIRANGYTHLYAAFVKEYFKGLNVEMIQDQPFIDVIKRADLYISLYSQTIFEASCMGIPVIYYKNDTQFIHPPFDARSELVTAVNELELMDAFVSFFNRDPKFELFKRRDVMEKYIGYLDGNNVKRNVDFVLKILKENKANNSRVK